MQNTYLKSINDCEVCSIGREGNKPIIGVGAKPSNIMFIGQSPSLIETEKSALFSGQAGVWLDRVIKAICFSREEVFITNIVKHFLPEDRFPYAEEIANCGYWLIKEVNEVKPKIVIPIGACALQTVLAAPTDIRISECCGKIMQSPLILFKDKIVFPLQHPSILMYNRDRNYENYCNDVANLFDLMIKLKMIEPESENWRNRFSI